MSFNLRHLKYFAATAELGRVSQAAIELSISQSAVTTAIKELEAVVGAQLFVRSSQGMILTDAGRQFLNVGYEILSKVEEALQVQEGRTVSGTLAVAATYTVVGYFLPFHLERIARVMPNLTLRLYEMTREAIEEALLARRFDMAVALTSNITNPEIATETLISSPRRLWTPANHPLLTREAVTLADVAERFYVMLTVDEAAITALRYWEQTPYRPNVVLRTTSIEAVRSMVANGQGLTILSDMVYRPWSLEGRRIETIELKEAIPPMGVGLAWRRDVEFSPAMIAFRDYFRSRFRTPQSMPGRLP